ncbi:PDGLE domain-containing protein [Actinocorallia sp. API 0066]|uniref:PDGLE domain-containing protein n=1 Tax=Actinocorallia sp. API 0066 TaxID=2896846 RepID=UPI001E3141EC|nr:PDGLE domain-containing protein [Actinocorallia sp. API 0066]MCD0452809.1 PDGLE domain-containing protein [Actinocorallia sp. API 0066]
MKTITTKAFLAAGLLVALVLAGLVSYYASGSPDGLEKVATDQGFDAGAKDHAGAEWPLADYGVSGVGDERLSGGLSGVIGVAVTLALGGGLFWVVRGRRAESRD